MVTEVAGNVPESKPSRPSLRSPGPGCAVEVPCETIVQARIVPEQIRLDVEEMQQVKQFLHGIDRLRGTFGEQTFPTKAVEIMREPSEVAAIRANLQRVY